jgi:hypothetical protein
MSESFDNDFCVYLEYHLGSVFRKSSDERIKHLWCDGVSIPLLNQLEKKFINDNRKLITKAWIGADGQSEYEMTIKFGKYSLRRFASGRRLEDSIPDNESYDWIKIDIEKRIIELQFL